MRQNKIFIIKLCKLLTYHLAGLLVHSAVGRLNEAVLVDAGIGGQVGDQADVGTFGGLDGADRSKQYTIVDWKTGKKPRKKGEIQKKLAQLDMYRILLSAMEGVPLTAIDACLYYLSEPIEGDRQLNAADKTEEEILAELSYGIPEQSDND